MKMAAEQTFRNMNQSDTEETTEAIISTKNFQDEVRQWFTALSPVERAAVLGFDDDFLVMAAIMAQTASPTRSSSSASQESNNNGDERSDERLGNLVTINTEQTTPTSSSPPKRMTDKLFLNEAYDWEAMIAIDIIEKTWEEIMMVGVPNTSGVNQKEFSKNSMNQRNEEKNVKPSIMDTRKSVGSIDNKSSNAIENQMEEIQVNTKASSNGDSKLKDTNNHGVVSDAFRISNEEVSEEGKSGHITAETKNEDSKTRGPTVTEHFKPSQEEEMRKANNDNDVGSSPTSWVDDEDNNACASSSSMSEQEFTTTATATASIISPSFATHGIGIEEGLQYSSRTNNSKRIADLMDNTRCIFPSASKIATAAIPGDHNNLHELQQLQQKRKQPFITINPSYLHSVSGDELLVAFDEIMAMAFTDSSSDEPCSFILPEEATSASWIHLVRSYATTETTTSSSTPSQSVPLYTLILCRFQYSLAMSYAGRNLTQHEDGDQVGNSQQLSHKSAAQWLFALMSRIHELEKTESTKIQSVLSNLASKFPEAGKSIENNRESKTNDLKQYLLLPFNVVAGRIDKHSQNSSDYINVLEEIDSGIEESLQEDLIASEKGPSDASIVAGSGTESVQAGDRATSDSAALPPGNENQMITNDGSNATSGGRKAKKKKKKKKRKGGAGANAQTKTKHIEKTIEVKIEDKGELEGKGDVTEKKVEISTVVNEKKENDAVINDTKVGEETPVTECNIQTVPVSDLASETSDTLMTNPMEEKLVAELPEKSGNENEIDVPPPGIDSSNVVHPQLKSSNDEINVSKKDDRPRENQSTKHEDHEDKWETVEIRPRGRKKGSDKVNTRLGSQHIGINGSSNGQQSANFKKKAPRTKETRAKTKTRKMVREILVDVVDDVEEKVRRRRTISRERANVRRNQASFVSGNSNSGHQSKNSSTAAIPQNSNTQQKTGSSLRDILVRGKGNNQNQQSKNPSITKSASFSISERARSLMASDSNEEKTHVPRRKTALPSHITDSKTAKVLKAARALPADQNTIPTIASTNSAFTPSIANVTSRKPGVALSSDSSSNESAEAQKPKNIPLDPIKYDSPSPPLPTLLSPGNNNSSSSSVASSLDAPHAGHHGNKSRQSENDVGCHLLDVCDRLSSEIDVFMERREAALVIRRHERQLVLSALGKTLSLIWPGNPSVELYGSCATNLDLPSSDLDVVVGGLDRPFVEAVPTPSNLPSIAPNSNTGSIEDATDRRNGSPDLDSRCDGPSYTTDYRYSRHQMSPYQMQMMYGHMSVNGERVLRLAMELEHQPWAVHVKAIPTATVPVIKILADPARLQGAAMNGNAEWLVQQPISGQSPPSMSSHGFPDNADPRHGNQAPMSHFQGQQSSPLWRGADVVNGLLKVDITFEGPEHGGIGSTKFSQKLIEDFSSETGLSPECTPQVQVLMVLKELLAQRRSNEPFSGGLSSYALLLLVISMIGERSLIREELEKTERQRRVVAAGGGNSALRSSPIDSVDSNSNDFKQIVEKSQSKNLSKTNPHDIHSNSANIAIKQNESTGKMNESLINTPWKEKGEKAEQQKPTKKTGSVLVSPPVQKKSSAPSSWASIARSQTPSSNLAASNKQVSGKDTSESNSEIKDRKVSTKPSSFADAVAKGKPMQVTHTNSAPKKAPTVKKNEVKKRFEGLLDPAKRPFKSKMEMEKEKEDSKTTKAQQAKDNVTLEDTKVRNTVPSSISNQSKGPVVTAKSNPATPPESSGFPQGFHDVIELLCSGETTPGKLLMHFLLFYGQHFESQSTAIDYSGIHHRDVGANNGYSVRSSYMLRRNAGSYDPITGMYTVDPIVVYDPLEGAENNNVARSCFAWSSIRWVFAQSYMTLSSAAEQNASDGTRNGVIPAAGEGPAYGHDESGHVVVDPSSPLLELLLSF